MVFNRAAVAQHSRGSRTRAPHTYQANGLEPERLVRTAQAAGLGSQGNRRPEPERLVRHDGSQRNGPFRAEEDCWAPFPRPAAWADRIGPSGRMGPAAFLIRMGSSGARPPRHVRWVSLRSTQGRVLAHPRSESSETLCPTLEGLHNCTCPIVQLFQNWWPWPRTFSGGARVRDPRLCCATASR